MNYKREFLWNSIAGIINAAEAVVMSMVVTRVTSLSDAGILALAFAVGNLLLTLGKFGVRNYQVSDCECRFTFNTYLLARAFTSAIMCVTAVLYGCRKYFFSGESFYKVSCVIAICFIYAIESLEDVVWGEYQRQRRLDLGAKMFVFRWSGILLVFVVLISLSRNLERSLWGSFVVSAVLLVLSYAITQRDFVREGNASFTKQIGLPVNKKATIEVLKETFPLFIVAFLTFYINNAAKYALDGVVSDEVQACYGFVSMPVFVIGLLNSMIYQPTLVGLTNKWGKHNVKGFRKEIRKQCIFIILIGFVCIIGAGLIGIPVLSILYRAELNDFWKELVILQLSGLFLAFSGYLCMILTIMRCQKGLMYGYCTVAVLAFLTMKPMILRLGTIGAVLDYLFCMFLLSVAYGLMYFKKIRETLD